MSLLFRISSLLDSKLLFSRSSSIGFTSVTSRGKGGVHPIRDTQSFKPACRGARRSRHPCAALPGIYPTAPAETERAGRCADASIIWIMAFAGMFSASLMKVMSFVPGSNPTFNEVAAAHLPGSH